MREYQGSSSVPKNPSPIWSLINLKTAETETVVGCFIFLCYCPLVGLLTYHSSAATVSLCTFLCNSCLYTILSLAFLSNP